MLSYAVKLQKRAFIFKKETLILNSFISNLETILILLPIFDIAN